MAIESINAHEDKTIQATQTVTCTTTATTTTMTKVLNEPAIETDSDELTCAQKPKILLYESTKEETQSDILTDDDTDSVGSSIDSKEIEAGLKEISQPTTQGTVSKIDRIETQMKHLSFFSSSDPGNMTIKSDEILHNVSRQLEQLDLQHDEENDKTQEKDEKHQRDVLSCSVQTLSSNETLGQEPIPTHQKNQEKNDSSVIVLSDSDTEETENESERHRRNVSEEPPFKPTNASSNDAAMYNISSVDSSAMQKVNNFFDNAPFIEPSDNSFSSSHLSKSICEDVYIPETTDEESIDEKSVIETSVNNGDDGQQNIDEPEHRQNNDRVEEEKSNFSDNNIIVDIPVIKSSSDQPRQLIRSQSGVRLTSSRSSPIIKNYTGSTTPGSTIRFNSNKGQVNIAAKININIQIVEDSSEESSEDNKPTRKSEAIQPSENSTNSNHSDTFSNSESKKDLDNVKTPAKRNATESVETPNRTPSATNRIKQFEFVPPKSMTKHKKPDANQENENTETKSTKISGNSGNGDGFQVDKNIPISPRDQLLLVSTGASDI